MKQNHFISAYTPSNTDPIILEKIFVQREKLLTQIIKKLTRSMLTAEKHHILLVGARGCGKTHLLTLVLSRLQKLIENNLELENNLRIAWLSEDDVFTNLLDIAIAIADALQNTYPKEFTKKYRDFARGLQSDEAALAILNALLVDLPDSRSILLVTENMDRTFNQLEGMGQRTWRAFLQEKQKIATLASAQQLVDSLTSRDEPFYGFFNIEHLIPLNVDQAFELILKITRVQQNEELFDYLISNVNARYRIRALHYLAGGNQRMYVILCELLTKGALDDLVSAFESLADELTPYFQERVRSLPPQQGKIVQYLCSCNSAQSVKTIADHLFIAETTCSKQLSELKSKRYVVSTKRGKQSFYEMSEPLMRLCLDIKNQRGRPLRLITQFVRAWFSLDEIHSYQNQGHVRLQQYCESALSSEPVYAKPLIKDLDNLIDQSLDNNNFEQAMKYVEELKFADCNIAAHRHIKVLFRQAVNLHLDGKLDHSILKYSEIINNLKVSKVYVAKTLLNRGLAYRDQDRLKLASSDFTAVLDMENVPSAIIAKCLFYRGVIHKLEGNPNLAILDYTALIKMEDKSEDRIARTFINRGGIYSSLDQFDLAISDFTAVIEMQSASVDQISKALNNRGLVYRNQNQLELALVDFTAVINMEDVLVDQISKALNNRGLVYKDQNQLELALSDFTTVINMENVLVDQISKALNNRGLVYKDQNQLELALSDFTAVINMEDVPSGTLIKCLLNRGVSYRINNQINLAILDYTAVINMADVPSFQVARALLNRALLYKRLRELDLALLDFNILIDMKGIKLAQIRGAMLNRAVIYKEQGDLDLALSELNKLISMPDLERDLLQKSLLNRSILYFNKNQMDLTILDFNRLLEMGDLQDSLITEVKINRGVVYFKTKQYELAQKDFISVLEIKDLNQSVKNHVLFAIIEPTLITSTQQEFESALLRAFTEGDKNVEGYGGTPDDLLGVLLQLNSSKWTDYIQIILNNYRNNEITEQLANGLVQSIKNIVGANFSQKKLDLWYLAWEQYTKDIEEFELPLQILGVAIETIIRQDKQPLLVLPLEIRQLILPLFESINEKG